MRLRISIRGRVRPSVGPSVRPSVSTFFFVDFWALLPLPNRRDLCRVVYPALFKKFQTYELMQFYCWGGKGHYSCLQLVCQISCTSSVQSLTLLGGILWTLLKFLSDLARNFFVFGLFLAIIGPFGSFRTFMGPQTNHMWVLLALPNDARHAQYN